MIDLPSKDYKKDEDLSAAAQLHGGIFFRIKDAEVFCFGGVL